MCICTQTCAHWGSGLITWGGEGKQAEGTGVGPRALPVCLVPRWCVFCVDALGLASGRAFRATVLVLSRRFLRSVSLKLIFQFVKCLLIFLTKVACVQRDPPRWSACLSPEGKFSCGIFINLSFVSIDKWANKFFNTNAAVLREGWVHRFVSAELSVNQPFHVACRRLQRQEDAQPLYWDYKQDKKRGWLAKGWLQINIWDCACKLAWAMKIAGSQ